VPQPQLLPSADVCQRAMAARDQRFDGIFYVGITSTGVYCRPVCPSRFATPDHRRFFSSAASAEHAGFRPCLRCRPELAPGRAQMDALPRLAAAAADRISAGALNGRSVASLAAELGVSERHLRRAVERAIGVSPIALAQTHRLLLAKRLLVDTSLPVTQIAFASGFQSLRRFNGVFRERYRLSPTALRHIGDGPLAAENPTDLVRLTLTYRPPLAWSALIGLLDTCSLPGAEVVSGARFARTVRLEKRSGLVFVENARGSKPHLNVDISPSLLPALMPLLARLRRLFDLDAEPTVVDAHLSQNGLAESIARRPGLRAPGAYDGFEVALALLLRTGPEGLAQRVVADLGEPFATNTPGLTHLAPRPRAIVRAGAARLRTLGASPSLAASIEGVARAVVDAVLRLEPGADVSAARCTLLTMPGIDDALATTIVMRALHWPDAFPQSDGGSHDARAELWRPWRAYAALHLASSGVTANHHCVAGEREDLALPVDDPISVV
jgi:AraC family transcriptional regulator of adaptative response / DNA-3-methyladenine glycosylase II